jgi:hypothetical protein
VLVRPDFYVFDTGSPAALIERLARILAPEGVPA